MRLCPGCHRYVTSAPSPDLGHGEVSPGVKCNLPHHPHPCPWLDCHDQPCTYQHPPPAPPSVSLPPLPLSPAASQALTYSQATGDAPAGDQTLLQQLEELRREKEEQVQRAEQLAVANTNLRQNQHLLSQQLLQQQSTVVSSSTTSTTTSTVLSSLSMRPVMGTGYSSAFGVTTPSSFSSAGVDSGFGGFVSAPAPSYLAGAAQSLAQINTAPPSVSHSIAGYTGPTIPDLRKNPQVNANAQEVLSYLFQQIPALASYPTQQNLGAPAPPLVPASLPPVQQPGALPLQAQPAVGAPFPAPAPLLA